MRLAALMVIFLLSLIVYTPAMADIFVYVDKEGVMHFSNAPTHNRYRVYMKEDSRSPVQVVKSLKPDTDKYDHLIAESCRLHGVDFARPHLHDRALAELALDLGDSEVYGAFPFRHRMSSSRVPGAVSPGDFVRPSL